MKDYMKIKLLKPENTFSINRNKYFNLLYSMLERETETQAFEAWAMIEDYKNDYLEKRFNRTQRNHLIMQAVFNYFILKQRIKDGELPVFMSFRFYANELNYTESEYI
jgi:hypothetical protein